MSTSTAEPASETLRIAAELIEEAAENAPTADWPDYIEQDYIDEYGECPRIHEICSDLAETTRQIALLSEIHEPGDHDE